MRFFIELCRNSFRSLEERKIKRAHKLQSRVPRALLHSHKVSRAQLVKSKETIFSILQTLVLFRSKSNGGFCVYYPSNIFHSTRTFENWRICEIIIWQGSLGVNPGVLIGSFLVGILPYGPFPWKWS